MNARLICKVSQCENDMGIPRNGVAYFERVVRRTEFTDPDPQAMVVDLFPEAEISWISCLEVFRLPVRRGAFVEVPQLPNRTVR